MDEFIKKLIARLEDEKKYCSYNPQIRDETINKTISIVNQLAEEYNNSNDSMEIQIAKNYAKWLTKCGVNVTEKWLTATEQEYALNKAYIRGRQDEMDKFAEWQNEHNGGWIPCSERLPEVNTRVMCFTTNETYVFAEYGGADSHYLSNKDVWFSDKGWYRKNSILAWQPLPAPYKEGEKQ